MGVIRTHYITSVLKILEKEIHLGAVSSVQEISVPKYGIWYFVFFLLSPSPKIMTLNLFHGITTVLSKIVVPILTTASCQ